MKDEKRITDPDPFALAADPSMVAGMISGGGRNGLSGTGDRLPMVLRAGSQDHLGMPSRFGDRLHYRDGRVVRLPSEDTEGGAA